MTLLLNTAVTGQSGTHVLAIGVGKYPHLLDGGKKLATDPIGLGQLDSPPVSLKAFLDWTLAPFGNGIGFSNHAAPLASVEAVCSSKSPVTIDTPTLGQLELEPATRDNIQLAFEAWLDRMKSHPDNIGVFYFCGHGVMVADQYLLAEDFGRTAQPWAHAFNVSLTIRAIEREVFGAVFFFIDSCRNVPRGLAVTLGAVPQALIVADLGKKVSCKHVTVVYATGEGQLAFAPLGGQVSRFTSALLSALSGYCGIKSPGEQTWNVDGDNVAAAIRILLQHDETGKYRQVCDQSIQGPLVPLLRIGAPPKVMVRLDLSPKERRSLYELYLAKGDNRVAQTLVDQVFKVDLPRGVYEVGALDPQGALPLIRHEDEDLVPPMYMLTLKSHP
ncbi:MAG: caspase family protein [Limnobacter sp.]|uniref:caspase family protein n=1 Tax=Limnobacter sp. TaxID=2003368 RepID=UPI00391C9DE7